MKTDKPTIASALPKDWPLSSVFMMMDIRGCQDSNGDGIGDLPGLISRLDHFQEVGIGALVFAGLQPSDFSYVGTMMTEFCGVDPRYGTLADFDRLLAEAHGRGIAILIGWSPYSSHPDHPYFAASRDPRHPRHEQMKDFYLWTDDINAVHPRDEGHWEWDSVRQAYYHTIWYAADHRWCPQIDPMSPRVRQENEKVIRFWLDRGTDGFWVDVGGGGTFLTREDHVESSRAMTDLVHSYPGRWIITEGTKLISQTVQDGYDSFLNNWARPVPTYQTVFRQPGKGRFTEFFEGLETQGLHEALLSFYDEHTGNQTLNMFKTKTPIDFQSQADIKRLRLQFLLHLTMPVIPMFRFPQYAGFARTREREFVSSYPFLMLWDDTRNHGFSTGMPAWKQNEEGYPPWATVRAQMQDEASPLYASKTFMNLRRKYPALQCHADVRETYARIPTSHDDDCLAYVRRHPATGDLAAVVGNISDRPGSYTLFWDRSRRLKRILGSSAGFKRIAGTGSEALGAKGSETIELPSYGYSLQIGSGGPKGSVA